MDIDPDRLFDFFLIFLTENSRAKLRMDDDFLHLVDVCSVLLLQIIQIVNTQSHLDILSLPTTRLLYCEIIIL